MVRDRIAVRITRLATMRLVILIFVAGGFGALLRLGLNRWVAAQVAGDFPWGTLLVNCFGSLLCGIIWAAFDARGALDSTMRTVLLVGFVGALTTFSTLALDSILLFHDGMPLLAIVNLLVTNVAGFVSLLIGVGATRAMIG